VTKACGTIACLEERFNFLLENYVKAYNLKIKDLEKQFSGNFVVLYHYLILLLL
jgi:hypothetical protein